MPTDTERAVLAAVDTARAVDELRELIRLPSVTGSDVESEVQHLLATKLTELGHDVDLWQFDLPALRTDTDYPGEEAPRTEGWGLASSSTGQADGPTLVMSGHVDVVPPGDLAKWPSGDPYDAAADASTIYGRGACDMKAGVVAILAALRALDAAGVRLRGNVAVHSVVSEEDGGLGAFATLRRGHTGDVCIIPEPTSGKVVTANAGALTFRLRIDGSAAHGSVAYNGVSAVQKLIPVLAALEDLQQRRNARLRDPRTADLPVPYPLSLGTVRAGDWASSVPDLLVADGRYGIGIGEDPATARAELEHTLAEVSAADPWLRDHPVTVEWSGGQFASGELPHGHPLLELVQRAVVDSTGDPLPAEGAAPYGSDLRHYATAGIPTLHYGPGDVGYAHAPREQVPVAELTASAGMLAMAAMRYCGVA
ncbi:MAG: ArgE/DapE family deacylase [Streptosporangiales bacterium]|nr:ArgE/DapE family deacylase [Streptosporangiales bacterium]